MERTPRHSSERRSGHFFYRFIFLPQHFSGTCMPTALFQGQASKSVTTLPGSPSNNERTWLFCL